MASPTTPTHGKLASVWRLRPNGYYATTPGLNDLTWGGTFSASTSRLFVVDIDGVSPDTFKWGYIDAVAGWSGYTSGVAITGAAQTLTSGVTVTFGATTGHNMSDTWYIGHLKDLDCIENVLTAPYYAAVTSLTFNLLNPNASLVWTDSGGQKPAYVDYANGIAYFSDYNFGEVTVTGENGAVQKNALQRVGYLYGWKMDASLEMAEVSRFGQHWKEFLPGQSSVTGSADGYMIAEASFFHQIQDSADNGPKYWFLQLFNYDPDQDRTGDQFSVWATLDGLSINAPIGEVVKESVTFTVHGIPSFTANT